MNKGNRFRFDLWLYNEMQKRNWEPLDLAIETGLSVPNIRNRAFCSEHSELPEEQEHADIAFTGIDTSGV